MELKDSVAFVTGGNRGIGEAFVRGFLAAGAAKVYVATRDVRNADHLVAVGAGRVVAVALDVSKPETIAPAAAQCGDVSILVNNAGQFGMETLMTAPNLDAARLEMEVNYFGPLALCRAFAPTLARHKESAIVNVLSAGGIVAAPVMGGYSPSKFAGRAMSTCLRAELAPQNTNVIALIVGSVDTRMSAHVAGAKESPDTIAAVGLKAIRRNQDEVDTDYMVVELRAQMMRDPKGLEMAMRKQLTATQLNTGR